MGRESCGWKRSRRSGVKPDACVCVRGTVGDRATARAEPPCRCRERGGRPSVLVRSAVARPDFTIVGVGYAFVNFLVILYAAGESAYSVESYLNAGEYTPLQSHKL